MASCIVNGLPRPMPAGVRVTYRDSTRAGRPTLMSHTKYDRPWVIATTFSDRKNHHGPRVAASCSGPAVGRPAKKRSTWASTRASRSSSRLNSSVRTG